MRELLRSNDAMRLNWLRVLLVDQGIDAVVFDRHTAILEGSASAITQRLMVADEEHLQARRILIECGEDRELAPLDQNFAGGNVAHGS